MAMGALFGIGPVYAEQSGLGIRDISPFMTAPVVACLLLQWPVGHLSDWLDRRAVISADAWTAGLLPVLALTAAGSTWWLIALMTVFGGLSLPPVCHLHRPRQRLSRTGAESGGAEMPEDTKAGESKGAHDCRARIAPAILLHFHHPWRSDAGGTSPGMDEVERSRSQSREQRREQLPRRTRCGTSSTFAEPNAVDSGRYASAAVGS
jgi:hypothetical protein